MAAQLTHNASGTEPPPSSASTVTHDPGPDTDSGKARLATLSSLPKSWRFTSLLPPDPLYPTPADSHKAPRDQITPRQVRHALFTYVRPEPQAKPQLLAHSPAALHHLGLRPSEATTPEFAALAAGNLLLGWDEQRLTGGYPWAQCYGGFQFGSWAGQLGDGRAISLFEATNPLTRETYEVQLKGAGITPYSRFADGRAVLRSSIREFVISEALHALGIPSTRALALTLLPDVKVRRETLEPGAIVVRLSQSWLRIGTFDLLRARGDRALLRQLATYAAEHVLGGWAALPARLQDSDLGDKGAAAPEPETGIAKPELEGPPGAEENRFARLYRSVVRRNAATVAKWQAYGFMNGVLNTDNTSVLGLSIDFGPFAFLDDFDPSYTPNHDDHTLRYSYRAQPTVIWWNLVRLGEDLGELLGAGPDVDSDAFVSEGVRSEEEAARLVARAEAIIERAGDEYKAVFLAEYKRLMAARLGLRSLREADFGELFSSLLDTMEALQLDFNHFFRRLSGVRLSDLATHDQRREKAGIFFHREGVSALGTSEGEARNRLAGWLDRWRARAAEDWGGADGRVPAEKAEEERMSSMKRVNPSFVPRGWILDEVIRRVEKQGERDVLRRIMHMALHPFEDRWDGETFMVDSEDGAQQQEQVYKGDREEEVRWTGDVPRNERAMQCSCSS